MTPGRIACAFAVFSVLCVLAIFLFPVIKGPYPAVHGPVTALLSMRAAARLRLQIVLAGLGAIGSFYSAQLCSTAVSWADSSAWPADVSAFLTARGSILRC
jgi:hypothetical protein